MSTRSISVIGNSKGLPQAGQINSMEAVSDTKRFLSELSLERMTVAPQFRLSQIAHSSMVGTNSSRLCNVRRSTHPVPPESAFYLAHIDVRLRIVEHCVAALRTVEAGVECALTDGCSSSPSTPASLTSCEIRG
jgi:hypothetical protein